MTNVMLPTAKKGRHGDANASPRDQKVKTSKRRREWGSEKTTEPLPIVHPRPSNRKIILGRLAIISTIGCWLIYVVTTIMRELVDNPTAGFRFRFEAVSYLTVVTFLTFSALMYLLARQGAMYRFRDHRRVPRAEIDRHFSGHKGGITVLVPSYAEEPRVVRQTLWSAALQEFSELRAVLLIDDSPNPADQDVLAKLHQTRALAGEIADALAVPARRFASGMADFEAAMARGNAVEARHLLKLAAEYAAAASWLEERAAAEEIEDHVDDFFVYQVLLGLAHELRLTEEALVVAAEAGEVIAPDRLAQLYRRLVWTFTADVRVFERKRYASLSHEANKAMNLNSYISLMGKSWRQEETSEGLVLKESTAEKPGDLCIPNSTYLLTLDADSLLLRDYCLRLVYFLEEPGNERVAVTQTPYSSFRGAPTRIERIAAASTDIQHILHQGKTYFGATFWVGANAVIRKEAIEDIVEVETVGGYEIRTYIQDRTVIEDTESSVDLGTHGWTLVNYPERLSYSATPPDFGSLIVQRRRWANGGLLILPKLLRQLRERQHRRDPILFRELLLRTNYMASIAWGSFGLIFLLAYPYDGRLLSPAVFLAAVPYFVAMGSDLRECGYRFTDIFRIYGFNLVLLPVNLAGVLKSIQQSITGEKIPFARTPKIRNRTAAPALYVVVPYLIVAFSLLTAYRDVLVGNWGNVAFAALNAVLAAWAIKAYIGIKNSAVDVAVGVVDWLFIPKKSKRVAAASEAAETETRREQDWHEVLYFGDTKISAADHKGRRRRRRAGSFRHS
jgi:cellulose synthase/poly-beta-1,6-N-acetylglucosamine synthase-like glycosyltransferase